MNPGELHHPITLEQNHPIKDGAGGLTNDWRPVATTWAKIEALEGLQQIEAMRATPRITHRITIRYRSDVHEAMRATYCNRVFRFRSVIDADHRREYLVIMADETVVVPAPQPVSAP